MSGNFIVLIIIVTISVIVFIWNGLKIEAGCYSISDKIKKQEDFAKELSDMIWGVILIIGVFILLAVSVLKLF